MFGWVTEYGDAVNIFKAFSFKQALIPALVTAGILALTACGGGSDASSSAETEAPVDTTAPVETALEVAPETVPATTPATTPEAPMEPTVLSGIGPEFVRLEAGSEISIEPGTVDITGETSLKITLFSPDGKEVPGGDTLFDTGEFTTRRLWNWPTQRPIETGMIQVETEGPWTIKYQSFRDLENQNIFDTTSGTTYSGRRDDVLIVTGTDGSIGNKEPVPMEFACENCGSIDIDVYGPLVEGDYNFGDGLYRLLSPNFRDVNALLVLPIDSYIVVVENFYRDWDLTAV